ncbi:O-antigen ligase family protein [Marivibrio halodurans]|uniref:O-antigen ligase family protein n=1 Tax=Marivibrio halodurans TaxID=2039722 RepID=A0A8J7S6S8_9PROT|nr:alpha/beta fold hydrolase [Marivibrio halodurans]MBP5857844.1 O-antigen ligase family protein [Marivibrio halodurans]
MQRPITLLRRTAPLGQAVLDGARDIDPARLSAVLLGLSVPSVLFGRAVFALVFGIAVILILPRFRDHVLRWRFRDLFIGWPGGMAGGTALWWALSSAFSQDPLASFEVVIRIGVFIAAAVAFVIVLAERADLRELAERTFLVAFTAVMLIAVTSIYEAYGLVRIFAPFDSSVSDPVYFFKSFTSVVAIAIPVMLWIGYRAGGIWLALALTATLAGGFVVLGDGRQPGRAAYGGLLAALLALGAYWGGRRLPSGTRLWAVGGAGAVLAALALVVLMRLPSPPVTEADEAAPPLPVVDFHRQAIWGFVLDKALERPLLGYGINTINMVEGAHDEVLDIGQEYVPSHPHNWLLEVLSETGIPGLLLLLGSLAALAAVFVRNTIAGRAGALVSLATLAAFWVSSLANFSIWSAWWQVALLSILVLPGARMIGPLTGHREVDHLPPMNWRRAGLIGLAAFLALALGLVWYARKTDYGYMVYKRLKADSPYLYEEISSDLLTIDPAKLIDAHEPSDIVQLRGALRDAVWGPSGVPTGRQPSQVEAGRLDPYGVTAGMEGVTAERLTMPNEANYVSIGYILTPPEPTGEAVIYQNGYAGDFSQSKRFIQALLEDGHTVGLLNFPGYGENQFQIYNSPEWGPVNLTLDYLLYYLEHPMRVYIEPAIVMANRLREGHGVKAVDLVGFSAGGWVTAVAAAADTRFRRSVSVASFLPLYLRTWWAPPEWTPPHLYAPLIKATNYLEIPLLASEGEGRSYLQVFNQYDRCCFMNRRGTLYQSAVAGRLETLGLPGDFGVAIDDTHAQHQISRWGDARILDFLENGEIRETERHESAVDLAEERGLPPPGGPGQR